MGTIRNIVFDFGGVLIDLKRSDTITAMQKLGVSDFHKELTNTFSCQGFLGNYERGLISTAEFRQIIRQMAQNDSLSDQEIDHAWCALLQEVPHYKLELLLRLKQDYQIYMLSNTNELHINHSLRQNFEKEGHQVSDYFDRLFFSFQMHLAKPDVRIFKMFLSEADIIPEETLYIDDSPLNIEAGDKCHLHTLLYTPGNDLTKILKDEGLLA